MARVLALLVALCALTAVTAAPAQAVVSAAGAPRAIQSVDATPCGDRDSGPSRDTGTLDEAYTESGLFDCAGNPITFYELHYDDGQAWDLDRQIPSWITRMTYSWAQDMTRWSIYVLSFGLTLPVIDYGAQWAQEVERILSVGILDQISLVPLLLTIAVVVSFLWVVRGAYALGFYELVLSFVIASVAAGALFSPYQLILGNNGTIETGRQLGLVFAHCMHNEAERSDDPTQTRSPFVSTDAQCWSSDLGADATRSSAGAASGLDRDETDLVVTQVIERQLVDTMIRKPHQLINYGRVIDGSECDDEYDDALTAATTPEDAGHDMYDAVTGCDDESDEWERGVDEVSSTPGEREMALSRSYFFSSLGMFAFAVASGLTLAFYSFVALVQFIQFVAQAVLGIIPGSARLGLWRTLADVLATSFMIMVHIMTIQATMIGVTGLLTPTEAGGFGNYGLAMTLMWVVAGILIWRFSAHRRSLSNGIAAILAKRPLPPGMTQLVVPPSKSSQAWRLARDRAASTYFEQLTQKQMSKTVGFRRVMDKQVDPRSRIHPARRLFVRR